MALPWPQPSRPSASLAGSVDQGSCDQSRARETRFDPWSTLKRQGPCRRQSSSVDVARAAMATRLPAAKFAGAPPGGHIGEWAERGAVRTPSFGSGSPALSRLVTGPNRRPATAGDPGARGWGCPHPDLDIRVELHRYALRCSICGFPRALCALPLRGDPHGISRTCRGNPRSRRRLRGRSEKDGSLRSHA
jgi:hypothetical protein